MVKVIFINILAFLTLNAATYKTYSQWEIDAIFSAWAIEKFVDKDAKFEIVSKDIKFDHTYGINTSLSKIRRTANQTSFESTIKLYNLNNSCFKKYTKIARVVELLAWKKSEYNDIVNFEQKILKLMDNNLENTQNLNKVFIFLDNYCKE